MAALETQHKKQRKRRALTQSQADKQSTQNRQTKRTPQSKPSQVNKPTNILANSPKHAPRCPNQGRADYLWANPVNPTLQMGISVDCTTKDTLSTYNSCRILGPCLHGLIFGHRRTPSGDGREVLTRTYNVFRDPKADSRDPQVKDLYHGARYTPQIGELAIGKQMALEAW